MIRPRVPDDVYELGYRLCTDGWQKAVAWRLAGALNARVWSAVRRGPTDLCAMLARIATETEDAGTALGEAAGLAAATATRWLRLPRLVQKIAQVIVSNAVPPVGEDRTAMLARFLRVIGVWICVSSDRPLQSCACFEGLVSGHTKGWIEDRLTQALSGLRTVPLV